MMNENAISNILMDVDFLEEEFQRAGKPQLMNAFVELRAVRLCKSSQSGQSLTYAPRRSRPLH